MPYFGSSPLYPLADGTSRRNAMLDATRPEDEGINTPGEVQQSSGRFLLFESHSFFPALVGEQLVQLLLLQAL